MQAKRWQSDWRELSAARNRSSREKAIARALCLDPASLILEPRDDASPTTLVRAALALASKGQLDARLGRAFGAKFALAVELHENLRPDDWMFLSSRWRPSDVKLDGFMLTLDQALSKPDLGHVRLALASGMEGAGDHRGFGLAGPWMGRAIAKDDDHALAQMLGEGVDPFALGISGVHPLDWAWLHRAERCAKVLAPAVMRLEQPCIQNWTGAAMDWSKLMACAPPIMSSRLWSDAIEGGCSKASRLPVLVHSWERGSLAAGELPGPRRFDGMLWRPMRRAAPSEAQEPPMDAGKAMALWRAMSDRQADWETESAKVGGSGAWLLSLEIQEVAASAASGLESKAGRPRI